MSVSDGAVTLAVPRHTVANLRRAIMMALPAGGLALLVLALLGHPLAGVFVFVGLGLGVVNSVLVQRAVVNFASSGPAARKSRFIGGVLTRLGLISVVALAFVALFRREGLGVLGGLALFQLLMLASASLPLLRELRQG